MIDIIMVLAGTFVLLFFITFFYLSKDIFLTGVLKVRKEKVRRKEPFYILFSAWLITIVLLIGEFVKNKPELSFWTFVGAGLVLFGGILRIKAKKQLHRFYSFHVLIQKDHKIVKKGVYRTLRHPLMAGVILMIAGLAVMAQSTYGSLLLVVAFIPASIYYTSQEEKALIEEFKDEYLTYMNQTKKFIPGVY